MADLARPQAGRRQAARQRRLDADADDLAQAGRLPGAGLTGAVVAKADAIALSPLQGRLGESEFSGQLVLGFGAARPRLSGDLGVAVLDPSPWLAAEGHTPGEAPRDGAPAWQAMVLRDIVPLDLDLKLGVDRWLGLPVAMRDTKLSLQAHARVARAPVGATEAGADVCGRMHLDTAAPMPTFALELAAQDLPLGVLARDLSGPGGTEDAARSIGPPALGQSSIGRVGENRIGADTKGTPGKFPGAHGASTAK